MYRPSYLRIGVCDKICRRCFTRSARTYGKIALANRAFQLHDLNHRLFSKFNAHYMNDEYNKSERRHSINDTISQLEESLEKIFHEPLPDEILSADVVLCLFPTSLSNLPELHGRRVVNIFVKLVHFIIPMFVSQNLRLEILNKRLVPLDTMGFKDIEKSGSKLNLKVSVKDPEDHTYCECWLFFYISSESLIYKIEVEDLTNQVEADLMRRIKHLSELAVLGSKGEAPEPSTRGSLSTTKKNRTIPDH